MNKRILVILCLLTVCCALMTAVAGEIILDNAGHGMTGSTTVILSMPASYTVTIPAALPISYGAAETAMTIGVSSMSVGSRQAVQISAPDATGHLVQTGGSGKIPFALLQNGAVFSSAAYTAPGQSEIQVSIAPEDWYEAAAGEYAATITFLVSIVDQGVTP